MFYNSRVLLGRGVQDKSFVYKSKFFNPVKLLSNDNDNDNDNVFILHNHT